VRGCVLGASTVNGLTLVSLAGELDISERQLLRHALDPSGTATLPDIALDLDQVDFMDCAVLGALVGVSEDVRSAGGCLRLSGLKPGPLRLLQVCRLSDAMCVHATVTSATATHCSVHREAVPVPSVPAQARRSPTAVRVPACGRRTTPTRT
jgi:anti-sigma B factor antagonist